MQTAKPMWLTSAVSTCLDVGVSQDTVVKDEEMETDC